MSAILYRSGSAWIIRALEAHAFATARDARDWARRNRLKLIRSAQMDRDYWGRPKA